MLRIKLSALIPTSIRDFPMKNTNPISHIAPKKTPLDEFLHCPILGSHFHCLQGRSYSRLLAPNNVSDNKGSWQQKTRKGRGVGPGKGNTAGRGHKGQKDRGTHKFGFEGGETPLCRRVPKRVFTNPCSLTFQPVGLGKIATLINCWKIDAGRARSPTATLPVRLPPFLSQGLPELKCSRRSSAYQVSSSLGSTRSFSVTSSSWTLDSLETNSPKGAFGLVPINGSTGESHSSARSELVEIIKHGNKDMEYKLNLAGSLLTIVTITEIFRVLNHQKISGLRFFRWLQHNNPKWHSSAKVCSLIVCNCGCLGDFETMRLLLLEFRKERICLDETAFSFLSLFTLSHDLMMDSVKSVLSLLDDVGGSCRNSGIPALIEMFCNLYMFDMAKVIIEITGRNNMHYNILLRHRCKRGHHEEARGIIKEMQRPTIKSYNYLLGSLCKNFLIDEACILVEEMEENGVHPDEITFEILIINSCITGKLDIAKQLLNKMTEKKLLPRLSTHSAILKAFFKAEQYGESHNYVIDSSIKYQQSGPGVYSLLAGLHLGKEHLAEAQDILIQMMNMDLRPNFRVYVKTLKQLQKTGRKDMAQDLENRYNCFFSYLE